ncbi:YbaK/EbsC family protein, partial [Streptococcus suis]
SGYAANLEMATSEYKPSTAVVVEEDLVKVATPDAKTIDEVAAFLNVAEEQTIKTMLFMADGEPVVALLVGNDQVNDVKLKNHLGADFFDVASPADAEKIFGAGFGS